MMASSHNLNPHKQGAQDPLLHALQSSHLDQFYSNFLSRGVSSLETLSGITLQEYGSYGVTQMEDRKKLFALIQLIKTSNPEAFISTAVPQPQQVPKQQPQPVASAQNNIPPLQVQEERIRVCIRKRPMSSKELAKKSEQDIMECTEDCLIVNEPKVKLDLTKYVERHTFVFDKVFDENATNEDVYLGTAFPLLATVLAGGKATCFVYGQTGSGKTHTMLDRETGVFFWACRDLLREVQADKVNSPGQEREVFVSFYEIYQGHLYDLLNKREKIHAREDAAQRVVIQGIKEQKVTDIQQLKEIFDRGALERSTGSTGANEGSSRSHAILQIILRKPLPVSAPSAIVKKRTTTIVPVAATADNTVCGKFSFIDLAGSERGADRGDTSHKTRMEGSEINKSLLALKECIRALHAPLAPSEETGGATGGHLPFRGSKLTQVLKDSFMAPDGRTCMVATVSPNSGNSEHSLNTLRYADRVKELKKRDGSASAEDNEDEGEDVDEVSDLEEDVLAHERFGKDGNEGIMDEVFPGALSEANLAVASPIPPPRPSQPQHHPGSVRSFTTLPTAPATASSASMVSLSSKESVKDRKTAVLGALNGSALAFSSTNSPIKKSSIPHFAARGVTAPAGAFSSASSTLVASPATKFTVAQVEALTRAHRQALREFTDLIKAETRVLSAFSTSFSKDVLTTDENEKVMEYLFGIERFFEKKRTVETSLRKAVRSMLEKDEED